MSVTKGNTYHLRERLHDLWIAGDDAVRSDYRDVAASELWSEYQWVADLTERDMGMVRGEIEPPPVRYIFLIEGDTETLIDLTQK